MIIHFYLPDVNKKAQQIGAKPRKPVKTLDRKILHMILYIR